MYSNIERNIGLHQELTVIYTVSPTYTAILYTGDGATRVREADGESIEAALQALDAKLKGIVTVRPTTSDTCPNCGRSLEPEKIWRTCPDCQIGYTRSI